MNDKTASKGEQKYDDSYMLAIHRNRMISNVLAALSLLGVVVTLVLAVLGYSIPAVLAVGFASVTLAVLTKNADFF